MPSARSRPPIAIAAESTKPETAKQEELRRPELAKEKAVARVAETQAQLETAKVQAQAKTDAAARAGDEAKAAEAARDAAVEAAEEASRKTSPVSVFISRKTQRLYIRQGYLPVFEGPVTIRDADKPIGTFVYTALGYLNNGADVRWSVVSMYKYADGAEPVAQPARKRGEGRSAEGDPRRCRRGQGRARPHRHSAGCASTASRTSCCRARPSSSRTKAPASRRARTPISSSS